jgi:hypothetical protein
MTRPTATKSEEVFRMDYAADLESAAERSAR